jgi:hypothetical protein
MVNNIAGLRSTLEALARITWTNIADGRRLGVGMGEVGITDQNMLTLVREHPSLLVRKYSGYEEARTGADWEWWLRTSDGWICLVFQAKVLNVNGRYPGITKRQADGEPQINLLLRNCLVRSERLQGTVWPLYCFYNSWQGGWPEGVQRYDGTDLYEPSNDELQLYGCAAANGWSVRQILADSGHSHGRTLRNSYLPVSRPWSMILSDPAESPTSSTRQIMSALSLWMPGRRQLPPAPPVDDISETGLGKAQRNRLDIYRHPEMINRPPEYVLDLLEGRGKRPRRLRPLARRVVVLPETTMG